MAFIAIMKSSLQATLTLSQFQRERECAHVQIYSDNAMMKTAVYKWVKLFLREEKVSLTERDRDSQQRAELKKTL
jgi:hypothetical protein